VEIFRIIFSSFFPVRKNYLNLLGIVLVVINEAFSSFVRATLCFSRINIVSCFSESYK